MKLEAYKSYLGKHGRNLAEVKKNQSDVIIDRTFKRDPNYKRVYILTRDGWKFEDAKYQIHTTPSILKDAVDYYLEFRPKTHYPIGSYVIIPDDTDFDINLTEEQLQDPWSQPVENRTQWWFIVGRDDARSYVRYNILKLNYEVKWIWKGQIMKCFSAVRNANSYTSCSVNPLHTARRIRKRYGVSPRICWDDLIAFIPKRKDEICLYGKVRKVKGLVNQQRKSE